MDIISKEELNFLQLFIKTIDNRLTTIWFNSYTKLTTKPNYK